MIINCGIQPTSIVTMAIGHLKHWVCHFICMKYTALSDSLVTYGI